MQIVSQTLDSFLTTNIAQEYTTYNPATTYTLEDDASLTNASMVEYGNYNYRSLTNGNTGNNPTDYENIKWVKWSVSQRHAMLDISSTTKSTKTADDIVVTFLRGRIDTLGLGYLTASGVKIEHYDDLDVLMSDFTQEISFSVNETVYDLWSYIYDDYTLQVDRGLKIDIPPIGYKIKVTIQEQTVLGLTECGFFIAGEAIDMGETLDEVGFNFNSFSSIETDAFGTTNIIKRNVQDLVDFETTIDNTEVMRMKRKIKNIYDDIVLFIIDPTEDSQFEHLLTLGKVQDASTSARVSTKTYIAWSIFESI